MLDPLLPPPPKKKKNVIDGIFHGIFEQESKTVIYLKIFRIPSPSLNGKFWNIFGGVSKKKKLNNFKSFITPSHGDPDQPLCRMPSIYASTL